MKFKLLSALTSVNSDIRYQDFRDISEMERLKGLGFVFTLSKNGYYRLENEDEGLDIEINSLEELIDFMRKNRSLILSDLHDKLSLTIYNSYVE